jgi:glycosyltransferase involved in cell wall biosynthesis
MKLSIITINKNNAIGLEKTIISVINQLYSDYEFIIIDGNSNDSSIKILEKYNNKIAYWISENDSGIYNAMNKGIVKANGDYCLFLNSGDYFIDENVLIDCSQYFNDSYQLIIGRQAYPNGKLSPIVKNKVEMTLFSFISEYYIPHQATFIMRKLFFSYGKYSENNRIISDFVFFYTLIIKNNMDYLVIDKPLIYFDLNGISNINQTLSINELNAYLSDELSPFILKDYYEYLSMKKNKFHELYSKYPNIFLDFGPPRTIIYRLKLTIFFTPLIYIIKLIKKKSNALYKRFFNESPL